MKERAVFRVVFCLLMMVVAAPANASMVKITFGGTLESVDARLSAAYSVGSLYSAELTFDTSAPLACDLGWQAIYDPVSMSLQVTLNGNVFQDTSNLGRAYVSNWGDSGGSFVLYSFFPQGPSVENFRPAQIVPILITRVGNTFSSMALPTSTTDGSVFNDWRFNDASNGFQFLFDGLSGEGYATISGTLENVRFQGNQVSPVPEPESYTMLLAGLWLLGWINKRGKQL
ncbi:hypothetical protein MTYP_02988 [Methylophilaceae bacterium]|nr:hypothetical protein MTYP_02988 [Methylophilaceae bacterium]